MLSSSACSPNKKNNLYGKVPLTKYQAGAPMAQVHIDIIGPLPKTERGNEHCLMMVDQFTKWVECIPLPSQKAEVTSRGAVDYSSDLDILSSYFRTKEETLKVNCLKLCVKYKKSIRLGLLLTDRLQMDK